MPESSTPFFDYYPPGWEEEVLDPGHIEWIYSGDETIKVRLQVDEEPPTYYVSAIAGVNRNGEEYVTNSIMNLGTSQAFEVAQLLIYAMNGAIGRTQGEEEFRGDN